MFSPVPPDPCYTHTVTVPKVCSWEEALLLLPPGRSTLAIGGNSLHRVPHEFVRRLAGRHDVKLHIVKTAGAYDIDLLCLAELVDAVSAGFVGYESEFGLARHYRRAVESGAVEAREHACYTVIGSLRAAAYGLGFLPVKAMLGSDLPEARGLQWIQNPYDSNEEVIAIPAIRPDLAVIHVQFADHHGNGVIVGPKNEDLIMVRAAERVLLTAEHIVETGELPVPIDHVDVPSVLVDAVVSAPNGAWPGSCAGEYEIDPEGIRALQRCPDRAALTAYLAGLEESKR